MVIFHLLNPKMCIGDADHPRCAACKGIVSRVTEMGTFTTIRCGRQDCDNHVGQPVPMDGAERPTGVMELLPCDSTFASFIGYDAEGCILEIIIRKSGEHYRFYDFPPEAWRAFKEADSKGRHFRTHIRHCFLRYERLSALTEEDAWVDDALSGPPGEV